MAAARIGRKGSWFRTQRRSRMHRPRSSAHAGRPAGTASRSTGTAHERLARTNGTGINRAAGHRARRTSRHAGPRLQRNSWRWRTAQLRGQVRARRNHGTCCRLACEIRLRWRTQRPAASADGLRSAGPAVRSLGRARPWGRWRNIRRTWRGTSGRRSDRNARQPGSRRRGRTRALRRRVSCRRRRGRSARFRNRRRQRLARSGKNLAWLRRGRRNWPGWNRNAPRHTRSGAWSSRSRSGRR